MIATPDRLTPLMERIEAGENITQDDVDRIALLQAFDVVKLSELHLHGSIGREEEQTEKYRQHLGV
jgi:hypothetical protein